MVNDKLEHMMLSRQHFHIGLIGVPPGFADVGQQSTRLLSAGHLSRVSRRGKHLNNKETGLPSLIPSIIHRKAL